MSGKPKRMRQIKQILLLQQQGQGKKTISRLLGYVNRLREIVSCNFASGGCIIFHIHFLSFFNKDIQIYSPIPTFSPLGRIFN